MNAHPYAADRSFTPAAAATLPWESDVMPSAEPEAWLISFVDVLILLLTLFVLLLAYQHSQADRGGDAPVPAPVPVERGLQPAAGAVDARTEEHLAPAEEAGLDAGVSGAGQERALPDPAPSLADGDAVSAFGADPFVWFDGGHSPADAAHGAWPDDWLARFAPGLPGLPFSAAGAHAKDAASADDAPHGDTPVADAIQQDSADAAVREVLAALADGGFEDRAEIRVQPGAVRLDVSDRILFAPASADLTAEGLALLDELAALLRAQTFTLSVEGHTDDVPIRTVRYPSNWELASARATEVTRRLIALGIAPDRLRAIGYADTRPRAANDSAAGRARNRRVAFVLELP